MRVRLLEQRIHGPRRHELGHRVDARRGRSLERVTHRLAAELLQRGLVRAALLAEAAGRLRAVDDHELLAEAARDVDRGGQRRPRVGRLVVAEHDGHARGSPPPVVTSIRTIGCSAVLGRSFQNPRSRKYQMIISTTPVRKMPTPITRGGPTPNQGVSV